jgi:AcrR family transcriptional regulator
MSPRTDIQYEKIRADKRKLIMESALEVFAQKTYQGASISMIAEKANISKGLLYNYFESKESLLKAIINEGVHDVWQYFDPNHDGILTTEEFLFFLKKSIQIVKENPNYWKLYTSLMFQNEVIEMMFSDYGDLSAKYNKLAFDLFSRYGIKDPEQEMLLFSAMVKGAIIQYVALPETFPIDKVELAIEAHYKKIFNI